MKKAVSLFLVLFMVLTLFPAQRVNAEFYPEDICPKCHEQSIKYKEKDATWHYSYCENCGYGLGRDYGQVVFDYSLGDEGVIAYYFAADYTGQTQEQAIDDLEEKAQELQESKAYLDPVVFDRASMAFNTLSRIVQSLWDEAGYFSYEQIDAHEEWEWFIDKDPTCGTPGSKHEECVNCGAKRNENTPINPTGDHSFVYDGITWTGSPEEGYTGATADFHCNTCQTIKNVPSISLTAKVTEPTCGLGGYTTYHVEFSNCPDGSTRSGEIRGKQTAPTGQHQWEWVTDEPATCASGKKHEECSVCHKKQNEDTVIEPVEEHDWKCQFTWYGNETEGYHTVKVEYTCSKCPELVIRTRGKAYMKMEVTEPTCIEQGFTTFSYTETEDQAPDGQEHTDSRKALYTNPTGEHDWEWVVDQEPTCTTAGVKHEKCINCGAVQNQNTEIEPAHNWVFTEFGWKGNETDGYTGTNAKFKCSGCGLLGFNYVGKKLLDVTVTEPTCKDKGYTTYTATVGSDWSLDGQDHTDSAIALYTDPDPSKHNYQTIIDKEPTCAPGIEHEECTVCHQKRNEDTEIPATQEHQWTWVTDEEATCGKEGKKHEKCSVCEAIRSENTVIEKTPHEWGEPVFSFAEDGTAIGVQTCRNDPEHTKTGKTEVINEPELTLPAETTDGKYVYTVTVTIDGKDYTGTIVVEIPHAGDEITYSYDGGPATWTEGTGKGVELRFVRSENDDITYSAFTGLNVDGVDVAEKYYDLTKGSAVVTLSADYLGTLSAGDHTIRASFTDGSAETVLTVKVEEPEVPATGVNDPRALYTWLLTLSLVSAAAALDHRKKIRG